MIASSTAAPRLAPLAPPAVAALLHIRDLIYKSAGIFQADNKLRLLEDRCQRRMQVLGIANLREYYECLTSRPMHQAELVSLLNEITIGETCFFRNQAQLDGIRHIILPHIIEAREKMLLQKVRIWSAGCSTGEEPYTLAILLMEESQSKLKGWTFELLATDLNERSIAHAKAGSYGEYSVRNLNPYLRSKYFDRKDEKFCVKPEVKQAVSFSRLNLLDDARVMFMKGVDLVLCCNVLIYFDVTSKRKVIQHFYSNLLPHGYLFLGHAESLYGITQEFRLVHLPSATAYMKSEKRIAEQTR
jgi:chemotaxis protein methyltransferase CheR